jgi:urease accessory protein
VDQERPAARVGRDGALTLRCERRGAATVLAACRCTLPLQVLTPLALDGDALVVSVLNPTGCVLGGDRLSIRVTAEADTHVLLTTPSATKVHRTDSAPAEQLVELTVGPGAVLEWLPDHTIPHTGAAYRQRLHARVASGATLVIADAFAVGRVARDERWRFALLESAISVTDDDGWLLHDRFVLGGDSAWAGLGHAEGASYLATVVAVTPGPPDVVAAAVGEALRGVDGVRAGVGRMPRRGIVVRCLAEAAPALADGIHAAWTAVRQAALGAPALDLRKY